MSIGSPAAAASVTRLISATTASRAAVARWRWASSRRSSSRCASMRPPMATVRSRAPSSRPEAASSAGRRGDGRELGEDLREVAHGGRGGRGVGEVALRRHLGAVGERRRGGVERAAAAAGGGERGERAEAEDQEAADGSSRRESRNGPAAAGTPPGSSAASASAAVCMRGIRRA